ncbi:phage terminase large subunit family protein [Roseomonas mucosa]
MSENIAAEFSSFARQRKNSEVIFSGSVTRPSAASILATYETLQRAMAALIPPPRLSLPEWIERNLRLPDSVSALPGPVRLVPYQRGIAEAISDPGIERVTLVKAVRVGLSTLLTATVGAFVANEPSPILLLLPTESDCRDYVVSDLEPIFAATPCLSGLLSDDAAEGGRNTLLSRRFPGGNLKVVASAAPRNLRRHNVRVLLIDEADAMEPGKEGDPVTLAERRTLSFGNRKIIMGSTPVFEETSNVLRSYATSDQRVFEVPCPACGTFAEILWSHIEWQPDQPETAAFRCPHCEGLIEERHKPGMVKKGRWRATRPEVKGHAGFRINALVSPLQNASWARLAAEFLTAKAHPDKLQSFVNTILAEGWREEAERLDESDLQARAEPFGLAEVPAEVLFITCGCDVQDDRIEITFLGWTKEGEMLILGHSVVWGSPADDSTWAEVDDALRTTWPHPNGGTLRVDAAVVDAGDGDWSERVITFCHPRFNRRVLAGKGKEGTRPELQASATKGRKLFIVGVEPIKGQLLQRLAKGRTVRFSADLPTVFYEQLTSEQRVVRYVRGRPVRRFERIPGKRAEALDCVVYGMAARSIVATDPARREAELATQTALPPVRSPVIPSKWLMNR